MNRFREQGFIEYNGRIRVYKSPLNVILLDQPSEQNSESVPLLETEEGQRAKRRGAAIALRKGTAVGLKIR
jgi:hypothetical protein